jgi:hypothetical protein
LSEGWVEESEELLRKMKELSSKEKRDRLETINSISFSLNLLGRSLQGWRLWVGNLFLMSQFTLEELTQIEDALQKQIQSFIEYDIAATKRWMDRLPQIFEFPRRRREEEESRGMYV